MTQSRNFRIALAAVLVLTLLAGVTVLARPGGPGHRTNVVAYFDNSNMIFEGDAVRILGVQVGRVAKIEPEAKRVKISFWYDSKYKVPADVKAAILSPALVTGRSVQLTPVYTSGPVLQDNAVIPQDRTAVPMEWNDIRQQLLRLSDSLQPTEPGGVSSLGALVNTTADNLRGQGANIRQTLIKVSQAFSALGDHSSDLFGTLKNLSTLVSALQDSTTLLRQLNQNLANVTGLLANDPGEVAAAVRDLNDAVGDVQTFVADNREALGTTSDKLASITTTLNDSLGDIKQLLHVAPNTLQNYVNIYQPAQGAATSVLALANFQNPVSFLCGAIQAASRLGAQQSAKLCTQYLAPIVKNRQYNALPFGQNLFVGTQARPNEITFSEDWMRPDYVPPAGPNPLAAPVAPGNVAPPAAEPAQAAAPSGPPLAAEATNPADGLRGMLLPGGGGS
ncbi:MAG TPA: MCE family protein [Mycobacterium sp.]|nr:MCE family protein [Mycobacterium sp.]